jgi:4-hydroxy-tetrahydrodipicolinate reductase
MGRLVAETVAEAADLSLAGLYDPNGSGEIVAGKEVSVDPGAVAGSDVVVEFTRPDVVMENLASWRRLGVNAVVGTSGFDEKKVEEVAASWGRGPPNCLIVPNFSVGAVLMTRFAELAAPHFAAAEIVELHHDRKADAPSGTATAAAARISAAADQAREVESTELHQGARGATIGEVPVHSVRLAGLLAHHEIIFGGVGETLTIRHDSTDRLSFMPGVLLAVRSVSGLGQPVTVGLDGLLGV